jgi:hypothetical protein
MGTVRRYPSHIAAQDAAVALRAAGIMATVVSDADVFGHASLSSGFGPHAVVIDESASHGQAKKILAELDANPISADPAWEESASAPDLSRLDPALPIPCPFCQYDLRGAPRDAAGLATCPECAQSVDILGAVIGHHGPEALAPCYPEPESAITDDILAAAALLCRRCNYSLAGLPVESHCPECGQPYSKRRMFRA